MSSTVDLPKFLAAVGPEQLPLPSGEVEGSVRGDWQKSIDGVRARGWRVHLLDGKETPVPPAVLDARPEDPDVGSYSIAVFPKPGVQINFFTDPTLVDFDFDLREIATQDDMDAVAECISTIGKATGKAISVWAEGESGRPDKLLRYDPDDDSFEIRPGASAPRQ